MMPYQTSLAEDLRHFGVSVLEIDGWRTRGLPSITPRVGVNHHTAGARVGAAPSLRICINGRPDVPGPLCNVLLGRDYVARLIAAGVSNNAGRGGWKGVSGNSNTLGLEIEHVGTRAEPVDLKLLDVAARIQAAFARGRYGSNMVCQHFEWTDRKIDFAELWVPEVYTPAGFRATVQQYLEWDGPKPPTPPIPPGGDVDTDKILEAVEGTKPVALRLSADEVGGPGKKGDVWVCSADSRYHVGRPTLNGLYVTGLIQRDEGNQPALVDPIYITDIPVVPAS